MKTLSFYQENRRQATAVMTKTKKPVERGKSLDIGNITGMGMLATAWV